MKLMAQSKIYTKKLFRELCIMNFLSDYDGFGHPISLGKINKYITILPSNLSTISADTTHIKWTYTEFEI